MGRLSPLMPRVCRVLFLSTAIVLSGGCDAAKDAAPKSRVQAVLVEPGAQTVSSSAAPERIEPVREPTPSKPRPPLCKGQLTTKAEAFKPKRVPSQISLEAEPSLAADPLKATGRRWTWVNFWAAWCVPCKEELPLLLRWQSSLAPRLDFVFVSLDDDERQLREFLTRQPTGGLKTTYWLPDGAVRQAWLQALGLDTEPELPLQLLIDSDGLLRCRVEGAVEPQDLAALERIVQR